jgi:hypothetical protein
MIQGIFNTTITIKRRLGIDVASRDSLNNPIYGSPINTWLTVYTNIPARIALSSKPLQFASIGERSTPNGIVYIPPEYILYNEDRILTSDASPIEYVITSVAAAYVNNSTIDHWEIDISLP